MSERLIRRLPVLSAIIGLLIFVAVIVGWVWHIEFLKALAPGYITMKVNTAICLGLCSLSLLLVRRRGYASAIVVFLATVTVIGLSIATLYEYLAGLNLGIDEFLVSDPAGATGRFPPGRLAPVTAVNFVFLASSLLIFRLEARSAKITGQLLAAFILFCSFQGIVGYGIGVTYLFGSAFYTQMALHTAVGFFVLAIGTIWLRPETGFLQSFLGPNRGSNMMRIVLLSVVIVPTAVRMLARVGLENHFYDQDFAQLLQIVGITGILSVITIIAGNELFNSERIRRDNELALASAHAEGEARVSQLADSMTQLAWMADPAGAVNWYNKRWYEYTGTTRETMLGDGWIAVHHPDYANGVFAKIKENWKTPTVWEMTFPLRSTNGDFRWFLTRAVPLRNADGKVLQWFGTNTDIHDQKLAADELARAKDEAVRANQLKSAFLANMSHEIRTPLGAMMGFANLLRDETLSGDERLSYLNVISRNGDQLAVIINDVLDLSKVEAGHLLFDFTRANMTEVVRDVATLLENSATEKRLEFEILMRPSVPAWVATDAGRIKQILVNLVGNAIKFTPEGRVTLECEAWIDGTEVKGVNFYVRDTGIGIPTDSLESVFEIFVQADGSITRRFGGTGLGLALSRRLARELGGEVRVIESREGVGTVFEVKIANRVESLSAAIQSSDLQTGRTSGAKSQNETSPNHLGLIGRRILVIDDSPDNRALISRFLQKKGVNVETAENGLLGVHAATHQPFDAILMDLQMPVMDGYTATEQLRAAGFTRPIIAVTAHAMLETLQRCKAVGFDESLTKPINFPELLSVLERLIA